MQQITKDVLLFIDFIYNHFSPQWEPKAVYIILSSTHNNFVR